MKNAILYSLALLLSSFLFINDSKANYVAGGDLLYIHLGDSAYQVIFKLYRDCSGAAAPDSVPLCVKNSCNSTIINMHMQLYKGGLSGKPTGNFCPNASTTCNDPSSNISGYEQYWYEGIVFLPSKCSEWVFSTYLGNRNNSINLQNSPSQALYIEATLNNTSTHRNNSPYYSINPDFINELGVVYNGNNGALDADGDSLWTYLVMPKSGVAKCGDTAKSMFFANASPSYNLNNNPFQTNNTFFVNGANGLFRFTPTQIGKSNVTMKTDEYRNGVLIGSIMRDMQVQVVPRAVNGSIGGIQITCNNSRVNNLQGPIGICVGESFSFCYDVYANDANAVLILSDNLAAANMSNATIRYTNQGTDTVHVVFTWTPTHNDIGFHSLIQTITDSTCSPIPIIKKYANALDFNVWGQTKAGDDVTICEGANTQLNPSGGGDYEWTVLPGGTANSLSSTTTANPIATPTRTTSYAVRSTINEYCPTYNKDTVTVFVKPATAGADAMINRFSCGFQDPGSDYAYLCPEEELSLCYVSRSIDAGALLYMSDNIATAMPGAKVLYSTQGRDIVTATVTWTPETYQSGLHSLTFTVYDSACAKPNSSVRSTQQTLDFYVWPPTKINTDTLSYCQGDILTLRASGGGQYMWEELGSPTIPLQFNPYQSSLVISPNAPTSLAVTSTINTQCSNNKDTILLLQKAIASLPTVNTIVSPDSIIPSGLEVTFTANVSGCNNPAYLWYINGNAIPNSNNKTYSTNKMLNNDKVWCKIFCYDTCSSPADTISNTITMRMFGTGINDVLQNNVNLYPNPNNGTFTLQADLILLQQKAIVEVVNMYGQVVFSSNMQQQNQQFSIDAPSGVYMLKVKTTGNNIITTRFTIR